MKQALLLTLACSLIAMLTIAQPCWSACCIEGCGTVPWTSCTADSHCTGGVCPGPIGSAIAFDPNGTCGQGAFSGCPATEVGECADGVNNDAWTGDTLTDCADPDCLGDPACPPAPAPALGTRSLMVLALALVGFGALSTRWRRASRA